jgi:hypothetical protein
MIAADPIKAGPHASVQASTELAFSLPPVAYYLAGELQKAFTNIDFFVVISRYYPGIVSLLRRLS